MLTACSSTGFKFSGLSSGAFLRGFFLGSWCGFDYSVVIQACYQLRKPQYSSTFRSLWPVERQSDPRCASQLISCSEYPSAVNYRFPAQPCRHPEVRPENEIPSQAIESGLVGVCGLGTKHSRLIAYCLEFRRGGRDSVASWPILTR